MMSTYDKVNYWIELSNYDFETAKAMLETRRYLYVGFMCHQVIEKALKAYWTKMLDEPPLKVHHLSRLAHKSGLLDLMSEEQTNLIDRLEPLNIEARYPSYKERLTAALTEDYCRKLLSETKGLHIWIKNRL